MQKNKKALRSVTVDVCTKIAIFQMMPMQAPTLYTVILISQNFVIDFQLINFVLCSVTITKCY